MEIKLLVICRECSSCLKSNVQIVLHTTPGIAITDFSHEDKPGEEICSENAKPYVVFQNREELEE
jgi:hypothetical protein